ncbi:MAG: peptide-methionine (S)-S-oxide reductase MsrA [Gemmatimonadaceae bacterium]
MQRPSKAGPSKRAGFVLAACFLIPSAVLTGESIARNSMRPVVVSALDVRRTDLSVAVFAGGCFWSMERPFDHVPGVVSTVVGYEGGTAEHPTYPEVNTGKTGYAESVQVTFDSTKVSYAKLLDVYWRNVDPFTREAQFCDHGNEYRTAIFYLNDAQRSEADSSRTANAGKLTALGPIVTEVVTATRFWPAEAYHQHYADHNAVRYALYRLGCGRDERLQQIWGDSAEPFVPSK